MAARDEFESFRGAIADLDADRERRIRQRFETLRAPTATSVPPTAEPEPEVLQLVPVAGEPADALRRRRRVVLGVAAALVLVTLIGALTLLRSSTTTTDIGSGIEDGPMRDLAARALERPDIDLQGEQALYQQKTTAESFSGTADLAPGLMVQSTETWARRDGTGFERRTPSFIARGPGEQPGVGSPTGRPITEPPGFLEVRDYAEIRALPTDPAALMTLVQADFVGTDDPTRVVEFLAKMLALDITPPAVRAAGFQAIGRLGAESIGEVTTPSGVTGVAYQGTGADGRPWMIVVDPESTKVLAYVADAGTGEGLFFDATRWREFGDQEVADAVPN